MYLTLEIIGAIGATFGTERRKVMGPEGGRIGRGDDNDWIVEHPQVSRQHALIRFLDGAFYIEGLGKNPLAINHPGQVVPPRELRILRSGDRIFIAQYEVRASISPTAPEVRLPEESAPLTLENTSADAGVMPAQLCRRTHVTSPGTSRNEPVSALAPEAVSAPPARPPASPAQRPDVMASSAGASPAHPLPPSPSAPSVPRAAAPADSPAPEAVPPTGGTVDLGELLRAAGATSTQISPALSRELAEVLQIVIEGVMEALRDKVEIRSRLRMPVTRVQAKESNPLKFSPSAEAALHLLLADRNRGYMPAPSAFKDAFADIRSHQFAILEAIRAAFGAMLAAFEPEQLQSDFQRHAGRRGLLKLGARSRLWDRYVEFYHSLTQDPDDSFRRLFGNEFAAVYEKQLQRLKIQVQGASHGPSQ